jgi:RimJ/RimL family protein N-acetyltransferase
MGKLMPRIPHEVFTLNHSQISETTVAEMQKLLDARLPSTSRPKISLENLRYQISDQTLEVHVIRREGKILAMSTLTIVHHLTHVVGEIHDVVAYKEFEGTGMGRALMVSMLDSAFDYHGALEVNWTSKPEREAANALYAKLTGGPRATNSYQVKKGDTRYKA